MRRFQCSYHIRIYGQEISCVRIFYRFQYQFLWDQPMNVSQHSIALAILSSSNTLCFVFGILLKLLGAIDLYSASGTI